jgi:uncharacterized membrane protein
MERNPTERNSTQQFSADRGQFGRGSLMSSVATGLGFSAVGMAAMYFLDPQRGARRRGRAANRLAGTTTRAPRAMRAAGQDIANRAYGMMAETLNLFRSDDASDQVIEARIRARMGHAIEHPGGVQVRVSDGHATLEGDVLASEEAALLGCVNKVRGVQGVENRLRSHTSPGNIPHLQGGRGRRGSRSEFMQENWSPAARVVAGAAGLATTMLGTSLLTRSITNTGPTRLLGIGGGRRAVDIMKTINVDAPIDVVYALWSNFDYFPQFMSNVMEVRRGQGDLSHWKVRGPAGTTVEWDAEITQMRPNEMIAWKSVEGATVPNAGYVLFEPNENGGTEVTVRLSYNPPAGAIGHAIAKAFGADPKSEMDQDLMRMKAMIETGNVPHDAAQKINESRPAGEVGDQTGGEGESARRQSSGR